MSWLFNLLTVFSFVSVNLWAANKQSCEISLVPKASQVIQDTLYHKPELAKEFISVLIEDHNLFFGPMIMSYFDRVLVKKGLLKANDQSEFTALNPSQQYKGNKKFLKDFDKMPNMNRVVISNEIWKFIEADLELDQPDVIEGLDVSVRFRKKILSDISQRNLNPKLVQTKDEFTSLDLAVARMVQLRATLLKVMNESGGTDLIKSFINQSLPIQAQFLSELQVNPQRDIKNTVLWSGLGVASFSTLFMGVVWMGFGSAFGMGGLETLYAALTLGSSPALLVGGSLIHEKATKLSPVQQKQCEACSLLAKGLRKQLELKGFSIDEVPALSGTSQVRSLELQKLPSLKSKEEVAHFDLTLPQPLTMAAINRFGLDLMAEAKRVINQVEALETSYESGISFVLDRNSEFMNSDTPSRLAYRLQEIQRLQPFIQGVIDKSDGLRDQLQRAIEYVKENVDAYNSNDDHLKQNLATALEVQAQTLSLAENRLTLARDKVISLATVVITESNLINEINLNSTSDTISAFSMQQYAAFLTKKRDPMVDALIDTLETTSSLPEETTGPSLSGEKLFPVVKVMQKEIKVSAATKEKLTEIASIRAYDINKSKTFSEKTIGRVVDQKYISALNFLATQNSFSRQELYKWFKNVDDLGEKAGFRSGVHDDHLIRMAPLALDRELTPKMIMDRFFEIDILGEKFREGRTLYDSSVASLTVSSFYFNASPRELVERAFQVWDTLKAHYPNYRYSDLVLAEMVELSYRYPKLSIEQIVKMQVQVWEVAKIGHSKLDDMFVNVIFRAMLIRNGGQIIEQDEIVSAIRSFYSIKGHFKAANITEGQAAEVLRLGVLYAKASEETIALLDQIVVHTGNDLSLAIDCLNELLLRIASKRASPQVTSDEIVEALRVIATKGHELLIDEYSKNDQPEKK